MSDKTPPTALQKYVLPGQEEATAARNAASTRLVQSFKARGADYCVRPLPRPTASPLKSIVGLQRAFLKVDDETTLTVYKMGKGVTYLDALLAEWARSDDPIKVARADRSNSRGYWGFKEFYLQAFLDRDAQEPVATIFGFGSKLLGIFNGLNAPDKVSRFGSPYDPLKGYDLLVTVPEDYNYSVQRDNPRPLWGDDEPDMAVIDDIIQTQPNLELVAQSLVEPDEVVKRRIEEALGVTEDLPPPARGGSKWGGSGARDIDAPPARNNRRPPSDDVLP